MNNLIQLKVRKDSLKEEIDKLEDLQEDFIQLMGKDNYVWNLIDNKLDILYLQYDLTRKKIKGFENENI